MRAVEGHHQRGPPCDRRGFGVDVPNGVRVSFAAAMQRMRRLRARISLNDAAPRFRELGIDVYFGQARFVDSNTLEVDGTQLAFKRAVIATGARVAAPPIPGLDAVEYLTNETLSSNFAAESHDCHCH